MKVRPVKWIVILLIVAGVAFLIWYSSTRPAEVETGKVTRGPIRHSVLEDGETRVADRFVLSAPVSGRLLRITREEGDSVGKDETVAQIDPLSLSSKVGEAQARIRALERQIAGAGRKRPKKEELDRAKLLEEGAVAAIDVAERELQESKAAAEQARREVVRSKDLHAKRTISSSELEEAELSLTRATAALMAKERVVEIRKIELKTARVSTKILEESAGDVDWEEEYYQAQITAINAGLTAVRDDLKRTEIKSPVAGKVLKRYLESESVVLAGNPILEVGDITKLEAEVDFLSEDVAHMREGMPVEISGRGLGDRVIEGKIKRIYPSAFEKTSSLGVEQQRVTVVATFDAAGTGLGDRYSVDVRVILEEKKDVLLVPGAALSRTPKGDWRVFELVDGKVRKTRVTIGLRDEDHCEVVSGLEEGATVVVYPDPDLKDGDRAETREED